jgi:BirA family transcriptional regulator, biotin operon repressor / biotin---[acetyl-CoA-carboxylase] ligase
VPEETAPFRRLDVAHIRTALTGSLFADVRYEVTTGSTNDDVTPLLARSDSLGATLVAEEQTAGRGRKAGRSWIAPPGSGLTFTTILPTTLPAGDLWAVPFWVALCVADGIARACAVHAELRWPNDLFVGDRKVAGILCVSRIAGDVAHVGCGVGINVVRPPARDLTAIDPAPAFLTDAAPNVLREVVLSEVLLAFERRLPALHAPAAIARTYEERAALAGARYRVVVDQGEVALEGTARGLGPEGALRLDVGGVEHAISLADARRL